MDMDVLDGEGKVPLDLCQDDKIRGLIVRKAEVGKLPTPHIGKGQIYRVTSNTYRLKERNLQINPFKNDFSVSTLEGEVEEKYSLSGVEGVEDIVEKSWLMKGSLFYFRVEFKGA